MDEIEEEDVVDYLEETTFDFDGRILRNVHEKFLAKSPFSLLKQSNGKNKLVKPLFMSFLGK